MRGRWEQGVACRFDREARVGAQYKQKKGLGCRWARVRERCKGVVRPISLALACLFCLALMSSHCCLGKLFP